MRPARPGPNIASEFTLFTQVRTLDLEPEGPHGQYAQLRCGRAPVAIRIRSKRATHRAQPDRTAASSPRRRGTGGEPQPAEWGRPPTLLSPHFRSRSRPAV